MGRELFICRCRVRNEKAGGLLIVSAPSRHNVPDEFLEICETILLQPEKQAQSTGQSTPKAKGIASFETPPGTQWHEVEISFIDSENVTISAKDKTAKKHYFDMGFWKGKSNKPVNSWFTLGTICEKGCLKYSQVAKLKAEKNIQELRKRLRAYFGIQDDPIPFTREHGYKPVFKVCMSESESRSVNAFTNNDAFDEKEDD